MVNITGIFMWDGVERRSDRYGFITVTKQTYDDKVEVATGIDDPFALAAMTNHRASIKVTVLEARKSGHIGDLSRGIFPVMPTVDAVFDLGVGTLRAVLADWSAIGVAIGLEPDDGRQSDWFDPHILYQLHDQTVEITITASDAPMAPPQPKPEIYGFTMEQHVDEAGNGQFKSRRLSDVLKEKP